MARSRLIDRLQNAGALSRWKKRAKDAPQADLDALRQDRSQARKLRAQLDQLIHVAESRLALPRIGSNAFSRPGGTLWSWRPQVWRGPLHDRGVVGVATKARLGDEIQLFHDCAVSELTLRQIRNQKAEDLAPFGLRLDVFRFDGSFLSLVVDLPKEAIDGLQKRHLIRLTVLADVEKPIEIFARLNIRHGPNTEQVVLELPMDRTEKTVEFDLAYTDLNEKRTEAAWIDLIFEGPEMNQITLRDLTLCRYPRAEL